MHARGVPPVDAPWTRCQIDVIDLRRVELDVLDEHRGRHGDAGQTLRPGASPVRAAEEILPDDVARLEPACLGRELLARGRRVLRILAFVAMKVSSSPCMPPTRNSSASTACVVGGPHGPGTSKPRARSTSCCCSLDQAAQPGLELRLLEAGRREQLAEVGADLGRVRADRRRSRPCSPVGVPLLVARAPLAPRRRGAPRHDREGDEIRPAAAAASGPAVPATAAGVARPRLLPTDARPPGTRSALRLTGRVFFEEVEVENVVVVRAHACAPVGDGAESTGCCGQEGMAPAAAKRR